MFDEYPIPPCPDCPVPSPIGVEMSIYIIRCGTPDCDWGFPVVDPWNTAERCYEEFQEHCVERHDLRETDTNAQMYLNTNVMEMIDYK